MYGITVFSLLMFWWVRGIGKHIHDAQCQNEGLGPLVISRLFVFIIMGMILSHIIYNLPY